MQFNYKTITKDYRKKLPLAICKSTIIEVKSFLQYYKTI